MTLLSARRLVSACTLVAATAVALVTPGAASAAIGEQCSGANVGGNGSTLQKLAQLEEWTSIAPKGFSHSKNAAACSGTQGSKGVPTVSYTATGSGPGIQSWGVGGHAANFKPENGFVGTDEPPNQIQKEEIESHGAKGTMLEIPDLQAAITVSVHLPTGCTATSTSAPGRLVLNNVTLEKIFRGTITKWSEITEGGDALSGSGCNPATTFSRVVRLEGSGTTSTFDKYLFLINKKAVDGKLTWDQLAEEAENTKWPVEGTVLRGAGNGGVATKIVETPSSIGYVNLADARNNGHFTPGAGKGGAGTPTFWVDIQRNGKGIKSPKYSDPSTNGDAEAKAESNCEKEVYTNGKVKFPPASTEEVWNEVTTKVTETKYVLCGFTYDLALNKYSAYPETTETEATTVENYYTWVLNAAAEGGQPLLKASDYLGLPTSKEASKNILLIAQKGAAKISD